MAKKVNTFNEKSATTEDATQIVKKKDNQNTSKNSFLLDSYNELKLWSQSAFVKNILGVSLILTSVYLLLAFISYLYTWEVDQSKVYMSSSELFINNQVEVKNWLGKLGAVSSNFFIHNLFGIGSFLFLPILFNWGCKLLFNFSIFNTSNHLIKILVTILWISCLMAIVFPLNYFYLSGVVGYQLNLSAIAILGQLGTAIGYGAIGLILAIIYFNIDYKNWNATIPNHDIETTAIDEPSITETFKSNKKNSFLSSKEQQSETDGDEIIDIEKNDEPQDLNIKPQDGEELLNFNVVSTESKEVKQAPIDNDLDFEVNIPTDNQINDESLSEFNIVQSKIESERVSQLKFDEETLSKELIARLGLYDPRADLSDYQFPIVSILNQPFTNQVADVSKEELIQNKDRIVKTLLDFGVEIENIKATIGPTVVLYEIIPKAGVKISKIKNLEDDIALSLSALGIRIIAPMPGKGTIGIEVPNSKPQIVPMSMVLASEKFANSEFDLPIALGKTISNEIFIADLAKMPHLLMAGATGQGKSVGLNAILASLLYKKHPSELKFVLVDPKKVELTLFNKIERHFLAKLPDTDEAIITDTKKVIHTLNSLCIEMDTRYEMLKNAQVRNIKEYNKKFTERRLNPNDGHQYLPYIVVVIDEFADLIITAGKEVETPIARIAQLARAVGIHLIIATQRPSVNVITGTIKANFPGRIAFRVASKIDSRTILDAGGAEQLIGRGDMLLTQGNDLTRIQCAFIDTPEVDILCDYIGSQRAYPTALLLPEYIDENGEGSKKEDVDLNTLDKMFDEAARLIVQHQQGSTSLIQRRLKLGYNRAGRIIDQLEAAGIVGPFEGSKARQVIIKTEADLEELMRGLKQ